MTAGIETLYKGTLFRSRLEARWAATFDLTGWQWIYEPFDAAGYIPDFAITGGRPLLVEVKPAVSLAELETSVPRVVKALLPYRRDVLFLGASPCLPCDYDPVGQDAGWMAEYVSEGLEEGAGEPDFYIAHASWRSCTQCGLQAVNSEEGSWACRPCGCPYSDNNQLGPSMDMQRIWREAGNEVRWSPGR